MQLYADVIGKEMKIVRSAQTCALGAAIAGAVVAGKENGGHESFTAAQSAMCGLKKKTFKPNAENHKIYQELFPLYRQLHNAFGTREWQGRLYNVMKDLLSLRDKQLEGS